MRKFIILTIFLIVLSQCFKHQNHLFLTKIKLFFKEAKIRIKFNPLPHDYILQFFLAAKIK